MGLFIVRGRKESGERKRFGGLAGWLARSKACPTGVVAGAIRIRRDVKEESGKWRRPEALRGLELSWLLVGGGNRGRSELEDDGDCSEGRARKASEGDCGRQLAAKWVGGGAGKRMGGKS